MREYAVGIIELAKEINSHLVPSKQRKHLGRYNPDARDLFPDSKDISDKDCEEASHAIYMDFGNYTIGHLVPGRGKMT